VPLGEVKVLCGDDRYLINNRVQSIIEEIRGLTGQDPECVFIDGDDLGEEELFDLLSFRPLFGHARVLILRRLPWLDSGSATRKTKKPGTAEQILLQYLEAPNPFQTVVLVTSSLVSDSQLVKQLKKRGVIEEIKTPNKRELQAWVKSEFAKRGVEADKNLVETIAGSGWDMWAMQNQIEKISLASGKERLGMAEARELLDLRDEVRVFAFIDALFDRDLRAACQAVGGLFAQGEPPVLMLYILTRQFLLVAQAKALKEKGTPVSEIESALNLKHSFVTRKLLRAAERFSWREIEAVFQYLLDADKALKWRGTLDERMLFEVLAVEICRA